MTTVPPPPPPAPEEEPHPEEEKKKKRKTTTTTKATIHSVMTSEAKRRAAHILATMKEHCVVDKEALLRALYRRALKHKGPHRIDHATWKRLLNALVRQGDLVEAAVVIDVETVTTLQMPASSEAVAAARVDAFVAKRVAAKAQAALLEDELPDDHPPFKKRRTQSLMDAQQLSEVGRYEMWTGARRKRSRLRYAAVSEVYRKALNAIFARHRRKEGDDDMDFEDLDDENLDDDDDDDDDAAYWARWDPTHRKKKKRRFDEPQQSGPRQRGAAIVAGVAVAPLARSVARIVVDAHNAGRRSVDAQTLGTRLAAMGSTPPRAATDAACSRLLRRGWAKHCVDEENDDRRLELPFEAAVDSSRAELRSALGDPSFFDNVPDASDRLSRRSLRAADVAVVLAARAQGKVRIRDRDDHFEILNLRGGVPLVSETTTSATKWRAALGSALHEVPWHSPTGRIHDRLKSWLAHVVFAAVLTLGAPATCRDIVDARRKKSTPALDDLETAAILFDLCDANCIYVDRDPPTKPLPKRSIFDDVVVVETSSSSSSEEHNQDPTQLQTLALAALAEAHSDAAPRFFATPDALHRFLLFRPS